jgi:hypothetical protein
VALGIAALLGFLLVGAVPLLPVFLRPLVRHRHQAVRFVAKTLAVLLFWAGFNFSLMAIWGAVHFVPAWWAVVIGVPLLQIPALWFGIRVALGGEGGHDDDR